ncbi:MAG TPA: phosphate signaling complex protein PhoU [Candidatus Omnitrophota bacterium]|nr:phosphate signaling complex protein PhoU [Candidatus Omnitrophota bacterium]
MQRHFDEDLRNLNANIIKMASLAEDAIQNATRALKDQDPALARTVINNDQQIDEMELFIEEQAIDLLARMQPMASDLRFITTGMKINAELERIADLAVNIAHRVLELSGMPHLKPLVDIPKLSALTSSMVKNAIDAFVNHDESIARKVILSDSEVDQLNNVIRQELVNDYMIKDSKTVTRAVPLLLIARHLERIGDHATNIAEDVIYMVHAKIVKHHPEKLDDGQSI